MLLSFIYTRMLPFAIYIYRLPTSHNRAQKVVFRWEHSTFSIEQMYNILMTNNCAKTQCMLLLLLLLGKVRDREAKDTSSRYRVLFTNIYKS